MQATSLESAFPIVYWVKISIKDKPMNNNALIAFTAVYLIIACINLYAQLHDTSFLTALLSKALLMPVLFVAAIFLIKDSKKIKWLTIALIFSWLGDISLFFVPSYPQYPLFLSGLALFLVAHLSYMLLFRTLSNATGSEVLKIFSGIILSIYVIIFCVTL